MNDLASVNLQKRNQPHRRKDAPGIDPDAYLARIRAERALTVTENAR